ncbi:MAG: redoxin family protein [Actinomycetota bacterium]|nr:MAG: putative Thioredoxin [Acidimicrobiaceae bacterium]
MTTPLGAPVTRSAFLAATAGLVLAACGRQGAESAESAESAAGVPPAAEVSGISTSAPGASAPVPATEPAPGTAASTSAPEAGSKPSVVPAAFVGATTIDGEPFDADSLAGRPTVAWFWAPWCVICRGEAPDVAEIAARYSGQVNFVGVAGRGEAPEMREFVADTDTAGFPHLDDSSGAIWEWYEIAAQPAYAFITDDGRVETYLGALGAEGLEGIIEQLIVA